MSIFNIFARKDINEGVKNFRENRDMPVINITKTRDFKKICEKTKENQRFD